MQILNLWTHCFLSKDLYELANTSEWGVTKKLAEKYEVEMPIVQAVNDILFNSKAPGDALNDLMLRDKKIENNSLDW